MKVVKILILKGIPHTGSSSPVVLVFVWRSSLKSDLYTGVLVVHLYCHNVDQSGLGGEGFIFALPSRFEHVYFS